MPYVDPLHQEQHVFGDVGGVVGNAFRLRNLDERAAPNAET